MKQTLKNLKEVLEDAQFDVEYPFGKSYNRLIVTTPSYGYGYDHIDEIDAIIKYQGITEYSLQYQKMHSQGNVTNERTVISINEI